MTTRLPSFMLLTASILLGVGCSATTTDGSSESDLTGDAPGSDVYAKLAALTPLASNLKPREPNGYIAGNFEGTTANGDVCNVSVYSFHDESRTRKFFVWEGTVDAYQQALRNDQEIVASNFDVWEWASFRDVRTDATSAHFSLKWVEYGDGERDHEVDIKAFDRPGGGIKVRTKKFGFDRLIECNNVHATGEGVAVPLTEGE